VDEMSFNSVLLPPLAVRYTGATKLSTRDVKLTTNLYNELSVVLPTYPKAMLIGLVGPTCSGKSLIASYLVTQHDFKLLAVNPATSIPSPSSSITEVHATFGSFKELEMHVLKRWQEDFVVCNVRSLEDMQVLK
jgi:hypothetical protein